MALHIGTEGYRHQHTQARGASVPPGFILLALLQYTPARWPVLVLAIMLGHCLSDLLHGCSLAVVLGYSTAHSLEVLEMLGQSYAQPHVRCQTDITAIALDLDTAIPFGLILNELVSNVFKHAFPAGRAGTLTVQRHQQTAQTACLTVRDDGVGLPPDLSWGLAPSLGLQIMHALARQVRGTFAVDRTRGTTVRVVFPLPMPTS